MAKHTRKYGESSFHGTTITTTVGKLKELFPNSYEECNDGRDKTNYDFSLQTDKGVYFTIYDWKEYRAISDDEEIKFHIGGLKYEDTEKAKGELLKQLSGK